MLLEIHAQNPEPRKIAQAAKILKEGGIVVYPTDTIYTFGCDLHNKNAIERIARIKGVDPKDTHFSLVCQDLKCIGEYSYDFSKSTFKMMKSSLPGAYTFILNANKNVPKLFHFKKSTIGIRVPDNNIARALAEAVGNPIIATSVHNDADPLLDYLTDPIEIHERYGKLVDLVIDGGAGSNEASTVIDATGEEPVLLREGKGYVEVVEV